MLRRLKRKLSKRHEVIPLSIDSFYAGFGAGKCSKCGRYYVVEMFGGWAVEYEVNIVNTDVFIRDMETAIALIRASYSGKPKPFVIYEDNCEVNAN